MITQSMYNILLMSMYMQTFWTQDVNWTYINRAEGNFVRTFKLVYSGKVDIC